MGDMADDFRSLDEYHKERKRRNHAKADPSGWTQHTDYHWSRNLNGHRLDYWPSTTRFKYQGKVHVGDVEGFIRNREKESNDG